MKTTIVCFLENHIEISSGATVIINGVDANDLLTLVKEDETIKTWSDNRLSKTYIAKLELDTKLRQMVNGYRNY